MSYPNMSAEVMEAIHYWFEDYPEVETDCYIYLNNIDKCPMTLMAKASKALEDMDRCPVCGTLMETYTYQEPHYELGNDVYETIRESYCPMCDLPHREEV